MIETRLARILTRPEESGGPRAGCLDEASLAALVDGGLPDAERVELEGHLADCGWCVRRLALLASLVEEEAVPEPLSTGVRAAARRSFEVRRRRFVPARWAAAAAIVALVSGGLGWQLAELRHRPPEAPRVRDSQRVVDEHTGIDLLSPAGTTLTLDAGRRVHWTAVPGSLSYTVSLSGSDGIPLWEGESQGTEIRLPGALALEPGTIYYVQVRAHLPDGRTLRSGHIELVLGGT